jgi:hypothetical protein
MVGGADGGRMGGACRVLGPPKCPPCSPPHSESSAMSVVDKSSPATATIFISPLARAVICNQPVASIALGGWSPGVGGVHHDLACPIVGQGLSLGARLGGSAAIDEGCALVVSALRFGVRPVQAPARPGAQPRASRQSSNGLVSCRRRTSSIRANASP